MIHEIEMSEPILNITEKQMDELKHHTIEGETLKKLKAVIACSWPGNKSSLDDDIKPYWNVREDLTVTQDLIFKE